MIEGELDRLSGRPRTQVIHARLQTLLPSVEMHTGQLTKSGGRQMDVQTLTLADESTTICREVDDLLLTDLPDGFVDGFDVGGDSRNVLDRTVMCDDHVLHVVVPQSEIDKFTKKPRAYDLELPGKDTTRVDVAAQ